MQLDFASMRSDLDLAVAWTAHELRGPLVARLLVRGGLEAVSHDTYLVIPAR